MALFLVFVFCQSDFAFAYQSEDTKGDLAPGYLVSVGAGLVHKVSFATATIPVTITTPPPVTTGTPGSGTAGLGTATAAIPTQIFTSSGLNTSKPLTFTLSSTTPPTTQSGTGTPVTTSGNSGTLSISVPVNNPAAPSGSTVTVAFNTASKTFTLTSPTIVRAGARTSRTLKTSSAIIRAAAATSSSPAPPTYQVAAPRILAFNSSITLDAGDSDGATLSITIPVVLYAAGEISDLVGVSTDQYGNFGTAASSAPVFSRDGQVMSFLSSDQNFGISGGSGLNQVIRYAVNLGTVDLMSQSTITGTMSGNASYGGNSLSPALSADGSTLAYASDAVNIYPLYPVPKGRQIYITAGNAALNGNATPSPVPLALNGFATIGTMDKPALNANGTLIAFESTYPWVPSVTVTASQIYVKNTITGSFALASSDASGTPGNANSKNASISDDGRYVLFESEATNLVKGASNRQIYLKDMTTGALTLVSGIGGQPGNNDSFNGKLSGQTPYTGQAGYAVFDSDAANLVALSNNGLRQVYHKDLTTGAVTLISRNNAGIAVGGTNPAISGDGRFVVFKSSGAVATSSAPAYAQIYVADAFAGKTALVSSDANGLVANAASDSPTISGDGRNIGFTSLATNLDGTGTNGVSQAYIAANKLTVPLATGFWVNPDLPGQYYAVEQSGDRLWLGGFIYNSDANSTWVFANPSAITASLFQGSLFSPAGGATLAGVAGTPTLANLGQINLTVSGQTSASLNFGSKITAIQRADLVTGGSSAGPVAGYPETGWWYAPSSSQSLFIEVQGTNLLATIASFTSTGQAVWYQTMGVMNSPQAYSGTVNRCAGSTIPDCSTSVGNVTLTFNSTLSGTATLPGGKTIPIQRFRF